MRTISHFPLSREVERKYGKKVLSYTDCLQLSKEIEQQTGFRLNVSTLRRFFGLVKANYPPSPTTRDILAKFTGYHTFEHFHSLQQTEVAEADGESSLLLYYLDVLFAKASSATYADPTWLAIMRQTILFLDKQPHLIDGFQRAMSKSQVGQDVYFEQFVNMDQLNGYYGKGLRYYLSEKQTKEAKIFGHSLLALRSFLTGDAEGLFLHYKEVKQYHPDSSIHAFASARYFATQLFFYRDQPEGLYRVLFEARSYFKEMAPSKDVYQSFPCFELVITEALILIGQPLEALFYLRERKKKKTNYIPPAVDVQLFSAFELYETAAFAMLGDDEKARKAFRKINPGDFYFLSRQYNNALYLLLEAALFTARAPSVQTQLDDVIDCLGFEMLYGLFLNSWIVNKKEQEINIFD